MKTWKLFWAWQDNDEAAWLQQMSAQGWHLERTDLLRNTNPEQITIQDRSEANAIFNNNESRMKHYRRILTFVAVISTPVFIMLLNGTLQAGLSRPGFFGSFYKVFTVIIGLYLILFIFGTIKLIGTISRRKRSLKE